jgi:hypothetical protein
MMHELVTSMVRLSAALTVFGMQQAQTTVEAMSDSQASMDKLRRSLDALTEALTAQVDESHRSTIDSMSKCGNQIVDRSWDTVSDVDSKAIMESATKIIRKTADALTDALERSSKSADEPAADAQPSSGDAPPSADAPPASPAAH